MASDVDPAARLVSLGIEPISLPIFGSFVAAVRTGDLLHTMGHWPLDGDQPVTGRLGDDVTVEAGRDAAHLAARALIGTLVDTLGDLDRVVQIADVTFTINATPEFTQHTAVADAGSDLLVDVFGDRGRHARLAVGVASLPANLVLELTARVQVRD
jgi:enamine deaminase RidA (YjgF/YER057c/UK114 family)